LIRIYYIAFDKCSRAATCNGLSAFIWNPSIVSNNDEKKLVLVYMSSFPGFYGDEGEKQQPGLLPNSDSRWCVCDPLPPSAALPLTEGENKVLTLQALISPR